MAEVAVSAAGQETTTQRALTGCQSLSFLASLPACMRQRHRLTPECPEQDLLQACRVKGRQKAQAAQVERHQRRHRPVWCVHVQIDGRV
jgi:hypothetical protein